MAPKRCRKNSILGNKKPKRSILSFEKKVEILEMIKAGASLTALGRMYGVKESTIRAIKHYGESMRAAFSSRDEINVSTSKLKRMSLTLTTKMEILERLKAGESATALGRVYGVNESTIRTIKKSEKSVRTSFAAIGDTSANIGRMPCHSHAHDAMEMMLYDWLKKCSCSGIILSPIKIREKAAEIYKSIDSVVDCSGKNKFVASNGWFRNFRQRFSLQDLKIRNEDNCFIGPDTLEDSHDW